MTLAKRFSDELEFIEVLKSKHARYINGVFVAKDSVAGDYVAPGCAYGQITESGHDDEGKYGPVTRGEVDGVTNATDLIALDDVTDLWNFQVGDEVELLDSSGDVIAAHADDDLTITGVNVDDEEITVENIVDAHDYSGAALVQKADGSSKAVFICLNLVDVTHEDALVGGITHGAVFANRLVNLDDTVKEELIHIAFEEEKIQGGRA